MKFQLKIYSTILGTLSPVAPLGVFTQPEWKKKSMAAKEMCHDHEHSVRSIFLELPCRCRVGANKIGGKVLFILARPYLLLSFRALLPVNCWTDLPVIGIGCFHSVFIRTTCTISITITTTFSSTNGTRQSLKVFRNWGENWRPNRIMSEILRSLHRKWSELAESCWSVTR